MKYAIRPYDLALDLEPVVDLWQEVFTQTWPITPYLFERVTTGHRFYQPGDHFVAEVGDRVVGFVGTQVPRGLALSSETGGISVIVVSPQFQRQGIGKALHAVALDHLRRLGLSRAMLGGGGMFRFWPGPPANHSQSLDFFRKQGWQVFVPCFDLVRSLQDYQLSPEVCRRMSEQGVEIRPAVETELTQVLALEKNEFLGWYNDFWFRIDSGDQSDILVAVEKGQVMGALLLFTPQSNVMGVNCLWQTLLGEALGGMGAVGVAEAQRGRGIGVALVAYGSRILKERGVQNSLIDWTSLEDFYARVGYRRWRDYWYSVRQL